MEQAIKVAPLFVCRFKSDTNRAMAWTIIDPTCLTPLKHDVNETIILNYSYVSFCSQWSLYVNATNCCCRTVEMSGCSQLFIQFNVDKSSIINVVYYISVVC
jgi:hypothetical protein